MKHLALFLFCGGLLAPVFGQERSNVPAAGTAWPLFRGSPQMTGVAASPLPDKLELLWKVETKDGIESTAAIADETIYLPTLDGHCYALRLTDGKQVWLFTDPDKEQSKSSPCIAGDLVVYGDSAGVLRALERTTGRPRWTYKTGAEIISSPTELEGRIIVGSYDESLHCVEAINGKRVWSVKTEGQVHCSPSLAGDQVVIAGCDGYLRFVAVKTGKETNALEIGGPIASTPAVQQEQLFFGTLGSQVVGVNWKKLERLWSYENPRRQFEYRSSAAAASGLVVIGGRDKTLHALDQTTGKERWSFPTRAKIDSSPVIAAKRVYFGGGDGTLYAIDLATGHKLWEYAAGSPFTASPAIAGGRLVIGTEDGAILCFGSK